MKKKELLIAIAFALISTASFAQVGIGTTTPDDSSMLDIVSSNAGVLLPRMTTTERDAIVAPAEGLLFYNLTINKFQYFSASNWITLASDVDCDFMYYPSQIILNIDKGETRSFDLNFVANIGTPGNLTTSFFTESANLDVLLNSVSNNGSPAPVTQSLNITLLNSSPAVAGDTGSVVFQVTAACGITKFIEVIINVTGCDFSITPNVNSQFLSVPSTGTNSVTFTLDINQLGTLPGTLTAITTPAVAGFTITTTNSGCSYDCDPSITFEVDTTIIPGTYTFLIDVTSSCGATNSVTVQVIVEALPRDCKQILSENPSATDGDYTIDVDGIGGLASMTCSCDMTTDGGGWTLVANYLYKGNTTVAPVVKQDNLPLLGSSSLNTNEFNTIYWGHAANSLLNNFNFTTVRFFGSSNRSFPYPVLHFKHTQAEMVTYFKTGIGGVDITDLKTNFSAFNDHSTTTPGNATSGSINQGDNAMIEFPFSNWKFSAGLKAMAISLSFSNSSLHRIWVR